MPLAEPHLLSPSPKDYCRFWLSEIVLITTLSFKLVSFFTFIVKHLICCVFGVEWVICQVRRHAVTATIIVLITSLSFKLVSFLHLLLNDHLICCLTVGMHIVWTIIIISLSCCWIESGSGVNINMEMTNIGNKMCEIDTLKNKVQCLEEQVRQNNNSSLTD